jgi:hypothetical protein
VSTLDGRLRALRLSLLRRVSCISDDSPIEAMERAYRAYYYVKQVAVREAQEPGEARAFMRALFAEPEFARFWSIRRARYRKTAEYQVRRRAYDRRRYEMKLRDERTTPEVRARLAEVRRRQRAKRKAQGRQP